MSFAEDIKNSNKCPENGSIAAPCDNCEYKETAECVPARLADNLSDMGYVRLEPMEHGVGFNQIRKAVLLFEDNTYIELSADFINSLSDCGYIKLNGHIFRKVVQDE